MVIIVRIMLLFIITTGDNNTIGSIKSDYGDNVSTWEEEWEGDG